MTEFAPWVEVENMTVISKFLLLLAQGILWTSLLSQPVYAGEVRIVASEFKFNPAQIQVTAGVPITLVLDNSRAATEHGISIPKLDFHLVARAGETARKTLRFEEAGEYPFICDLPGHTESGMHGKFLVSE
jgi:uncharacterized cupredoxin-like copper-binding protein